jgi:type IV secretory pathway TrbF-like protein
MNLLGPWLKKPAIATNGKPADEHEAQRSSIEELVLWRRIAMISMKVAAGSLIVTFLVGGHDLYVTGKLRGPALATVYAPLASGGLTVMGGATEVILPNDEILTAGVRTWLLDVRCLNGIASCEYQRNQAKAMTDAKSTYDPKGHLDAYFAAVDKQRADDPTMTRTVTKSSIIPMPVVKDAPYRVFTISWVEQATNSKGTSVPVFHTGQVTIANAHPLPTDPDVALLNPNGVYVEAYASDSDLR